MTSGSSTRTGVSAPSVSGTASARGLLPPGPAVIIVGRPSDAMSANLRGVVLTELITGGALIALLAVCGNWLIGRGRPRCARWRPPPT